MAYTFNRNPLGPIWDTNSMMVAHVKDGQTYQLQIYPDYFNNELRAAGLPMHFYYKPDAPRMSKDSQNHYKFNFVKFEGVLTPDDNIDAGDEQREVAGGILSFTSDFKIPDDVIENIKEQLKNKCLNDLKYSTNPRWLRKSGMPEPELGVVPIVNNVCAVTSITMEGTATDVDNPWLCKVAAPDIDLSIKDAAGNVVNNGTTNPVGQNAYTIMLGQYPAAILQQCFKGGSAPIVVANRLQHCFFMEAFSARIQANFEMCATHFSAQLKVKAWWVKADLQAAFNDLVKTGAIKYEVTINNMILTPEEKKTYTAYTDKIQEKFFDWMTKTMLETNPPKIENAKAEEASSGFLGLGGGASLAMKFERNQVKQDLNFEQVVNENYLEYNIIKSQMNGMFDEIKADPDANKRYFQIVHLDEAFRKVHIIGKAIANWKLTPTGNGEPINSIVLEVGYPDSKGKIVWKNSCAQHMDSLSSEKSKKSIPSIWDAGTKDRLMIFDFARLDEDAPADIDPNLIHVRKTIFYEEDPRVNVADSKNCIVVEETTTDRTIVISAETIGTLKVTPIQLDTDLPSSKVQVNVTFKAGDYVETKNFNVDNMKDAQVFEYYTDSDRAVPWTYSVEVVVKGKFPKPSLKWSSPAPIERVGSMPLVVQLPEATKEMQAKVDEYLA